LGQPLKLKMLGFLFFILLLIPSSYGAQSKETDEPNISGFVTMPEELSVDALRVFSTANGLVTEIKNDSVVVLENKDMGVNISGYIQEGVRGDKVKILILRPDKSVYTTNAFLNDHSSYMIPVKLHTKWVEGAYKILVSFMDKEEGKIRFFVTDRDLGVAHGDGSTYQNDLVSKIFNYLDGSLTKTDLSSSLKEIGWSQYRIDTFFKNNFPNPWMTNYINGTNYEIFLNDTQNESDIINTPIYESPYLIYLLVFLGPLIYFVVWYLPKVRRQYRTGKQTK